MQIEVYPVFGRQPFYMFGKPMGPETIQRALKLVIFVMPIGSRWMTNTTQNEPSTTATTSSTLLLLKKHTSIFPVIATRMIQLLSNTLQFHHHLVWLEKNMRNKITLSDS